MTKKIYIINGKEIPEEIFEIIIERVKAMPPNLKLAVLGKVLTREQIIKEIEDGTPIGEEIFEIELSYYNDLVRD